MPCPVSGGAFFITLDNTNHRQSDQKIGRQKRKEISLRYCLYVVTIFNFYVIGMILGNIRNEIVTRKYLF